MSPERAVERIPARLTVKQLGELIDRDPSAIGAALAKRAEPSLPEDIVEPNAAVEVASELGVEVRVESRDLALERLYEIESRHFDEISDDPLPDRAEKMVVGVLKERETLDTEIEAASEHWAVARMPMIDRAILRLALWEIRNEPGTPPAVVVSEAVRLASTYSTKKSGAFVNGVLAALAKEHS